MKELIHFVELLEAVATAPEQHILLSTTDIFRIKQLAGHARRKLIKQQAYVAACRPAAKSNE